MEYFKTIDETHIQCLLCRHYCKIKEGHTGICGVNKNVNGRHVNLVHNHPVAIHVDPVEKKPINHFLPGTLSLSFGTVGCNFRCPFCQNWQISQEHFVNTSITVTPEEMVKMALERGCDSISYTYNEPTIFYPYAKDIGVLAKEKGLKNIFVTNGFESPEVIEDMQGWLDAARVDLKSWDRNFYKNVLKGDLDGVLDTLRRLAKTKIWIEVITLVIEGTNDRPEDLEGMAKFIHDELGPHVPWHVTAFHPDYKWTDHESTQISTLERAVQIGKKAGLYYVYTGNVPLASITYCPGCGEELIVREGYWIAKNILKNGHCPKCGRAIEGVWA